MRILLINPNSSQAVLKRLDAAARAVLSADDELISVCAPSGIELIMSEAHQRQAAKAVLECAMKYSAQIDGIIIGSFGDTGIQQVRAQLNVPVVGIAHAAMSAALKQGSAPAILSFSEQMRSSFELMLQQYGFSNINIYLLPTVDLPAPGLIAQVLADDLLELARQACYEQPSCLILGGGPLAGLASEFRKHLGLPIIDGTEEAVKLLKAPAKLGQ